MFFWLVFSSIFVLAGVILVGSFLIFKFFIKKKNQNLFSNAFFTEEGEEIHIGI